MDEPKAFISEKQKWRPSSRSQFIVVIVGVLVLAVAGVWFAQHQTSQSDSFSVAMKVANTDETQGNFVGELEAAQAVIGDAHNKQQSDELYTKLTYAETNLNNVGQALQYLQTKHNIDPSTAPADAYLMGTLYEQNGNTKLAITQYELAITYLKTQKPTTSRGYSGSDIGNIQDLIQVLKGSK